MHYTGQDMLWLVGSLSRIFRVPFDPQLVRQQFPPPYSRTALLNALQALGFKVGEMELDDESIATLERIPLPAIAFLREDKPFVQAAGPPARYPSPTNRPRLPLAKRQDRTPVRHPQTKTRPAYLPPSPSGGGRACEGAEGGGKSERKRASENATQSRSANISLLVQPRQAAPES